MTIFQYNNFRRISRPNINLDSLNPLGGLIRINIRLNRFAQIRFLHPHSDPSGSYFKLLRIRKIVRPDVISILASTT